jgi:hypothetical protein
MQEKLEYTKGVIRAVNRIRTEKKSSKMQNGVIRGLHRKMTCTKSLKIQRNIQEAYTEEGQTRIV